MRQRNNRTQAFELVDRAIRLQLFDDADLSEVEQCFQKALTLDPESIDVLGEAAHFYDAVVPNVQKAQKFAVQCREKALMLIREMDNIIGEASVRTRR
jgi:hypothetical protein